MANILCVGEMVIDFLPGSEPASYIRKAGGAPANVAIAAARQGCGAAFCGMVGDDDFGHFLMDTLKENGVAQCVRELTREATTTMAFVTLDAHGDREFAFSRKPGADTQLRFSELELPLIDDAKAFHFGTLSLTDEPARATTYRAVAYAKERGKLITFDPNLRKPLWKDLDTAKEQMLWGLSQADVVKISDEEIEFLFGLSPQEGAKKILSEYGVKLVFATCGADGCWFENQNACGHVDSLKGIKVVDTTGAGDIFGGSAVWKVLQTGKRPEELSEAELREIVCFACAAAGLSTTRPGGISSVPEPEEVNARLA